MISFPIRIFAITLLIALVSILGAAIIGQVGQLSPFVYIAKFRDYDEIRLVDLQTSVTIALSRAESYGALDVSSDGTVALTEHTSMGSVIKLVSLDIETPVPMVYGTDDNPVWSPDGTVVAYRRYYYQGGLYIANGIDRPRPLRISATAITWAPEGERLAYSRWEAEENQEIISVVDVRTRQVERLAAWRKPVQFMRWSPDGTKIAIVTIAGDFFILDVTTGEFHENHTPAEHIAVPQWSPDGRALAFILREDRTARLAIVDENGHMLHQQALNGLTPKSYFDWWIDQS